jgi:rhodanese-related sulfurtransferase
VQTDLRLLPLVGACNFRDLGGYPTEDGRVTRWGQLFRSDTLHELTEADLEVLRKIGLASVIDLRTGAEVERTGRGRLEAEPIGYLHLSVIQQEGGESQGTPAPTDGDLADRYLWYLDVGRDALAQALTMVGHPTAPPLVFHCAAGKDRTGVLAALILDILGVEQEVIAQDYAVTGSRMELILARLRRDPWWGDRVDKLPARQILVEARTMAQFLDRLRERHGGAREWALAAGVPEENLDAMENFLVSADG